MNPEVISGDLLAPHLLQPSLANPRRNFAYRHSPLPSPPPTAFFLLFLLSLRIFSLPLSLFLLVPFPYIRTRCHMLTHSLSLSPVRSWLPFSHALTPPSHHNTTSRSFALIFTIFFSFGGVPSPAAILYVPVLFRIFLFTFSYFFFSFSIFFYFYFTFFHFFLSWPTLRPTRLPSTRPPPTAASPGSLKYRLARWRPIKQRPWKSSTFHTNAQTCTHTHTHTGLA